MIIDDELDRIRTWARAASDDDRPAVVAELLSVYVQHRPLDEFAWFLYGDALRELGRFVEAEAILLRVLPDAPPNRRADVMARLGMLKGDHGSLDEAETWFEQAIADEFGRSKGWIWILRGANLAVAGRFDEAIFCHRQATLLPGDRDEAYLNLGYVLRAKCEYSEAIECFQAALELTPDYAEAKTALDGLADIIAAAEIGPKLVQLQKFSGLRRNADIGPFRRS
jgi:superkiller protein 3